jgi:hypothetical protein
MGESSRFEPNPCMAPDSVEPDLFELTLHGGPPERRYRHLRPQGEATLPWGTLDKSGFSAAEIAAARLGWTEGSLQEYVSAAAQAQMFRELVRARVPLDLSAIASRFCLDELAHAELCARVAVELGGAQPVPYREAELFPETQRAESSELTAARLVLWDCGSECFSHELLRALWQECRDPLLRAVRGRLAKDEAGHASFLWVFLAWLLPGLEPEELHGLKRHAGRLVLQLRKNLERSRALPDELFSPIAPAGGLGKAGYSSRGEQAIAALEKRLKATGLEPIRS